MVKEEVVDKMDGTYRKYICMYKYLSDIYICQIFARLKTPNIYALIKKINESRNSIRRLSIFRNFYQYKLQKSVKPITR